MKRCARVLCALVLVAANRAAAADPFFLFVAHQFDAPGEGEAVGHVLARYFTSRDYIGAEWRKVPEIAGRIGVAHTFAIPGSVKNARRAAGAPEIGLVMYDIEHWTATPQPEQRDPAVAIRRAAEAVRAIPGKRFGITPDGRYLGITAGKCAVGDENILRAVDFAPLDVVQLQAQRLLSDKCAGQGGAQLYTELVSANAKAARLAKPGILVAAQFSFRYTPPERMIAIIRSLGGTVDGYYLAYPANSRGIKCGYCAPENLEKVLAAFRTKQAEN